MKRRNFIFLGTAGVAAVAIPSVNYYFGSVEYHPALKQPHHLALILEEPILTSVGKQYLQQAPHEDRERTLVNLIDVDHTNVQEEIVSALDLKITDDFTSRNTVMIDGWVLSLTEVRQCALLAKSQIA